VASEKSHERFIVEPTRSPWAAFSTRKGRGSVGEIIVVEIAT
jgi:hypothetical protein